MGSPCPTAHSKGEAQGLKATDGFAQESHALDPQSLPNAIPIMTQQPMATPAACVLPTAPTSAWHGAALGNSPAWDAHTDHCAFTLLHKQCPPELHPLPRSTHHWSTRGMHPCGLWARYWGHNGCERGVLGPAPCQGGHVVGHVPRCGCWSWRTNCRRSGRSWGSCARSTMSWLVWQRAGKRTVSGASPAPAEQLLMEKVGQGGEALPAIHSGEEVLLQLA